MLNPPSPGSSTAETLRSTSSNDGPSVDAPSVEHTFLTKNTANQFPNEQVVINPKFALEGVSCPSGAVPLRSPTSPQTPKDMVSCLSNGDTSNNSVANETNAVDGENKEDEDKGEPLQEIVESPCLDIRVW
jgi:hypothetical protein